MIDIIRRAFLLRLLLEKRKSNKLFCVSAFIFSTEVQLDVLLVTYVHQSLFHMPRNVTQKDSKQTLCFLNKETYVWLHWAGIEAWVSSGVFTKCCSSVPFCFCKWHARNCFLDFVFCINILMPALLLTNYFMYQSLTMASYRAVYLQMLFMDMILM